MRTTANNHGAAATAAMLVLIALACSGWAVSLGFGSPDYKKGDLIEVSGTCGPSGRAHLDIEYAKKLLAEQDIDCNRRAFVFYYQSSFLDPSGGWSARAESDGNFDVAKTDVSHAANNMSAYQLITFLSPTAGEYRRNEDLAVKVRITDAGTPVEDANVLTWGVDGHRIYLNSEGAGMYSADYTIPYDTDVTSWSILVTSQSGGETRRGGEHSIIAVVKKAPIAIETDEPKTSTFELGDAIPIKFRAAYFNGKPLVNPVARVFVGEAELVPEAKPGGVFETAYTPGAGEEGSISFEISVEDDAGNSGRMAVNVVAIAGIIWFMKSNLLYIIATIVVVAVTGRFVYGSVHGAMHFEKLKKEREKTMQMIKVLQRDYFELAIMPRRAYEKSLSEYKAKLGELSKKIALAEEKNKKAKTADVGK